MTLLTKSELKARLQAQDDGWNGMELPDDYMLIEDRDNDDPVKPVAVRAVDNSTV